MQRSVPKWTYFLISVHYNMSTFPMITHSPGPHYRYLVTVLSLTGQRLLLCNSPLAEISLIIVLGTITYRGFQKCNPQISKTKIRYFSFLWNVLRDGRWYCRGFYFLLRIYVNILWNQSLLEFKATNVKLDNCINMVLPNTCKPYGEIMEFVIHSIMS